MRSINEYLLVSIGMFEQGWTIHEKALKDYELNQAKFTHWT